MDKERDHPWDSVGDSPNSSAENRELDDILRKLGGLLQGSPSLDWQADRQRCADLLRELGNTCPKSRALTEKLRGAKTEIGGSEHILIRLDSEPTRVFKATYNDNLGCRSLFYPHDPELTGQHFHATGNADLFIIWNGGFALIPSANIKRDTKVFCLLK